MELPSCLRVPLFCLFGDQWVTVEREKAVGVFLTLYGEYDDRGELLS